MPTLVSHKAVDAVTRTNDAADGSGNATVTKDVVTVTVVVEEELTSGKVARATVNLIVDDIADTQAAEASFSVTPNTPMSEADLTDYDAFVTYVDGLIDSLKLNYPTA